MSEPGPSTPKAPSSPNRWPVLAAIAALILALVASLVWSADDGPGLDLSWRLTVGESVLAPTVVAGEVYVTTESGMVVAASASDGRPRFRFRTGQSATAPVAVGGGRAFLPTSARSGGEVFAIDARTGEQQWRERTVLPPSSLALDGGILTVAAGDVVGFDVADGDQIWRHGFLEGAETVLASHGVVVVSSSLGLTALDAVTGVERWTSDRGVNAEVEPVIVGDLVLTADGTGAVVALGVADGILRWRLVTRGLLLQSPVGDAQAGVVLATIDGVVLLDLASGTERWRKGPALAGDLRVAIGSGLVVASTGSQLVAYEARTGDRLGSEPLEVAGSPPAVASGLVLSLDSGTLEARTPDR